MSSHLRAPAPRTRPSLLCSFRTPRRRAEA
jgi:hypothetical protein